MAQQTLSNGESGLDCRNAINDNFTELYNDKAWLLQENALNSLTTGSGFWLSSSSLTTGNLALLEVTGVNTPGSSVQWGLKVSMSGAHSNSAVQSNCIAAVNSHSGTNSSNVGFYADISGGSDNIALYIQEGEIDSYHNASADHPIIGLFGSWVADAGTASLEIFDATNATVAFNGSANGTVLGVNSRAAFSGNFVDLQKNSQSVFSVDANGKTIIGWFAGDFVNGTQPPQLTINGHFGSAPFSITGQGLQVGMAFYPTVLGISDTGQSKVVTLQCNTSNILQQRSADSAQELQVFGASTGSKYVSLRHDGTDAYLDASSGTLRIKGLPTSSAGLASGTLWNNSGTIAVA